MPVEIGKVEKWLGMISKLGYKFFWTRIVRVRWGFLQEKATVEKLFVIWILKGCDLHYKSSNDRYTKGQFSGAKFELTMDKNRAKSY